jgi:O-antigen biosynthesis protein
MQEGIASPPVWGRLELERQDDGHYVEHLNEGLLKLLEGEPRRVLDLGCATGVFGAAIKKRHPGAFVAGVEANEAAAARAATRLDELVRARLEELDFERAPPAGGGFTHAVAADILEHLVDPWRFLLRLKAALAPRAFLLASIPNVRNLGLVSRLLQGGRWEYTERGLLDVTHLRFFAYDDMRAMFTDTGYVVEAMSINLSPELAGLYQQHRAAARSTLRLGRITFEDVGPRELTELCAEQFLFRCRAA